MAEECEMSAGTGNNATFCHSQHCVRKLFVLARVVRIFSATHKLLPEACLLLIDEPPPRGAFLNTVVYIRDQRRDPVGHLR